MKNGTKRKKAGQLKSTGGKMTRLNTARIIAVGIPNHSDSEAPALSIHHNSNSHIRREANISKVTLKLAADITSSHSPGTYYSSVVQTCAVISILTSHECHMPISVSVMHPAQ
jgi:hypothetical protein